MTRALVMPSAGTSAPNKSVLGSLPNSMAWVLLYVPTETLFEQQRSAFGRLQAVVKSRVAGESIVAEAFAVAAGEAEREVAKARKQVAASRKRTADELTQSHEAGVVEARQRHDGEGLGDD